MAVKSQKEITFQDQAKDIEERLNGLSNRISKLRGYL